MRSPLIHIDSDQSGARQGCPGRLSFDGRRDALPTVRYRIGDRCRLYSVVKIQFDNRLTVRLRFNDPLLKSKREEI